MTTHNDIEVVLQSTLQIRYEDAHLEINLAEKIAFLDSRRLVLTRKEYELLVLLVQNPGEVVPREVLLMRVWGVRQRDLHSDARRTHPPAAKTLGFV